MYEEEDNYMYAEEEEPEEIPTEKWQEYSWITISAFIEEKGKLNIWIYMSQRWSDLRIILRFV